MEYEKIMKITTSEIKREPEPEPEGCIPSSTDPYAVKKAWVPENSLDCSLSYDYQSNMQVTGDLNIQGNVNLKPSLPPTVYYTNIRTSIQEYYGTGDFYPTFYIGASEVIIQQSSHFISDSMGFKTVVAYTIGTPTLIVDKAVENEIEMATSCLKFELESKKQELDKIQRELSSTKDTLQIAASILKENGLENKLEVGLLVRSTNEELNL